MGEVNVQLRTRHGLFLNQKRVGTENEKENKIENGFDLFACTMECLKMHICIRIRLLRSEKARVYNKFTQTETKKEKRGSECGMTRNPVINRPAVSKWRKFSAYMARNWQLYLLFLPVVVYFIVFHYMPMLGVQIAFKNYSFRRGIWGSKWVGLMHFERFFNSYYSGEVIYNTLMISIYSLIVRTPLPILLALLMNEVQCKWYRRTVQTITYAPYFISTVVMCSMVILFLSPDSGFINTIIEALGGEKKYFMGDPSSFKTIYVLSATWQYTGWDAVIYMAALADIDPQLHEAAMIDGAGRFRRIWHINLPGIMPTVVILLIMSCGTLMNVGFEKIFLLQNDLNRSSSDVISTLVYRQGLEQRDFSYSTAVNLFNSVVNCILLVIVNTIAKKLGDTSLW